MKNKNTFFSPPILGEKFNLLLRSISAFFLSSYVFFVSWTDAFRLGTWMPLYLFFMLLALMFSALYILLSMRIPNRVYSWQDGLLIVFLLLLLINVLLLKNDKSINYLMAYYLVFGGGYLFLKLCFTKVVKIETILNVNCFAVIIVGLFCCLEFFTEFLVGFDIQLFMGRTKAATATMSSGLFSRSYGFATEPTVTAFYLDVLGPLGLWQLFKITRRKVVRIVAVLVVVVGWGTLFSAAAFLVEGITISVVALFLLRPHLTYKQVGKSFFVGLIILCIVYFNFDIFNLLFGDIVNKILLKPGYVSVDGRLSALAEYWGHFCRSPLLGSGLGFYSAAGEGSPMNWFLFMFAEIGFPSTMVMIIFLLSQLVKTYRFDDGYRVPFFMGIMAGIGHLATLSTFFNPFLWLLLAIQGGYIFALRAKA